MASTRWVRALVVAAAAVATVAAGGALAAPAAAAAAPSAAAASIDAAGVDGALSRGARVGGGAPPTAAAARWTTYAPAVYGGTTLTRGASDFTPHIARLLRVRPATPTTDRRVTIVCTGLLLTERHVATLASCPYTPSQMVVLAGGGGVDIADGIAFNVTRRVVPAAFNATTGVADVAVWTFAAPDAATAAGLAGVGIARGRLARAAAEPRPATRAVVGGWGLTDPRRVEGLAGGRPTNLTIAVQSVTSAALCASTFQLAGAVFPPDVFCAAGLNAGPCVGDEGAPIVAFDDTPAEATYFVGLYQAAFSTDTFLCEPRAPAVYTRLSAHIPFLTDAVVPFRLSFFG